MTAIGEGFVVNVSNTIEKIENCLVASLQKKLKKLMTEVLNILQSWSMKKKFEYKKIKR